MTRVTNDGVREDPGPAPYREPSGPGPYREPSGPAPYREPFGAGPHGEPVDRYRLAAPGISAVVLTYGAVVQSLEVLDAAGASGNVVVGLDSMADYLARSRFFGCVVGRYGNRIAKGAFTLDGRKHRLPRNDGANSLHGGPEGFHARVWRVRSAARDTVALAYRSPDGEAGYPGTLDVEVRYTVAARGGHTELRIDYEAVTDAPTHVNLTNHSYFDLGGGGDIGRHEIALEADHYLPVDGEFIPIDGPAPVTGTPFDLTTPRTVGDQLALDHPQLRAVGGFDHCFVLHGPAGTVRPAARLRDPDSGRVMEVLTSEPGVQFYTGNRLADTTFGPRSGLCLETQHFPDSPNRPAFPSTELRPGRRLRSTTVYRFGTDGGPHTSGHGAGARTWR